MCVCVCVCVCVRVYIYIYIYIYKAEKTDEWQLGLGVFRFQNQIPTCQDSTKNSSVEIMSLNFLGLVYWFIDLYATDKLFCLSDYLN